MSHWTDAMDQARQSGRAEVGKIAADLAVMVARGEDEVVRLRRENARLRSRLARVLVYVARNWEPRGYDSPDLPYPGVWSGRAARRAKR